MDTTSWNSFAVFLCLTLLLAPVALADAALQSGPYAPGGRPRQGRKADGLWAWDEARLGTALLGALLLVPMALAAARLLESATDGAALAWPLGGLLAAVVWLAVQAGAHLTLPRLPRRAWSPLVRTASVAAAPLGRLLLAPLRRAASPDQERGLLEAVARLLGHEPSSAQMTMMRSVLELGETTVWEIMVPRVDIVAVEASATFQEVARTMVQRGFSRLPVYEETIDNVIGVVHARDVLRVLANGFRPQSVRELLRPAYFVPDTKPVHDLLAEMQRQHLSIAIVVDEYGGTAGLVTVEDIVEEIVGELADEFDTSEEPVQPLGDGAALVDARVTVDALEEMFGVHLENEDYDTVGGFIYHHLGKVPSVGDQIEVDGLVLRVVSMLGRKIKRVHVSRSAPSQQQED
ncbi:Hemolysin C [bacterium HR24]|nr:Hemolysin C [bacterium HR24]